MSELNIIIGPPGTGKTSFLARQLERAAEKYDPGRIMACSYTRAAVAELNRRELPIPEGNIGTLHSIGYRALGCPEMVETSAGIKEFLMANKGFAGMFEAANAADMDEVNVTCPALVMFNYLRSTKCPLKLWPPGYRMAYEAWCRWKGDRVDYADMIDLPLQRRLIPDNMPEVGFFDEAQDFTPLEADLVHWWGENMDRYFLVGDPDQSIYKFKGSDPSLLHVAGRDHRVLTQSWRVPAAAHRLAQRIIRRNPGRLDCDYRPTDVEGEVHQHTFGLDSPADVADLARSLTGSTMILASCSYMLAQVVSNLKATGTPYHNPFRRKRGDWNPLWQSKKRSANTRMITRLNAFAAINDQTTPWIRSWTAKELLLWEPLVRGVFGKNARSIMLDLPQDVKLSTTQLADLMGDEHTAEVIWHDYSWLKANLRATYKTKCEYFFKVLEQHPAGYHEYPNIIIGTIHSVKGGEADNVIIAPDLSYSAIATANNWPEIYRVFYVAVTRARHNVHLLAPSQTRKGSVPAIEWPQ